MDEAGYRLGYGGGFFDRTLASLARKPVVIGVSYELARIKTIRPQAWDIPMDWVVTERGTYRRDPEGLAFSASPAPASPARSPPRSATPPRSIPGISASEGPLSIVGATGHRLELL